MSFQTTETLQRLMQTFLRKELAALPPDQRQLFEQQFENRFNELLKNAANGGMEGFLDLVGFGGKWPIEFENLPYPYITPDFDDSVIPSQLHAAAELYYIYQHERMRVFQVIAVLRRLFHQGRMCIQRGPGARALYTLEKWTPLRYTLRDRMIAYRRAFNYGTAVTPAGAIVNRNFHRQLVGFMVALGQYFRDLLIGEVIRGGPLLEQPAVRVHRYGAAHRSRSALRARSLDLRQHPGAHHGDRAFLEDRASAPRRPGHQEVLRRQHQVGRNRGGLEPLPGRHRRALAARQDGGKHILQFVADNDFKTAVDPILFQSEARPMGPHAEAWLAAYRMTPEGRGFSGVTPALRNVLGIREAVGATV